MFRLAYSVALLAAGCFDAGSFTCLNGGVCRTSGGVMGICEADTGFCSFPDTGCESGRRYGAHAGGGLSDECVPAATIDAGIDAGIDATTCGIGGLPCCEGASCQSGSQCVAGADMCSCNGVTEVAAGAFFTCARIGGAVVCWGANMAGQVGDGTTTRRLRPVATGIADATSIAAGGGHACAALAGGGASCWGLNFYGQVGDGTSGTGTNKTSPAAVSGLSGVTAVAAGGGHSCALAGGAVKCWGLNDNGQLGDASSEDRATPVDVMGLTGVAEIAAGYAHTCARLDTGMVVCWGDGQFGQLGDGMNLDSPVPIVAQITNATALAAGAQHTCARKDDGTVWCWGRNTLGQLGDGMTDDSAAPVQAQVTGADEVAAGRNHTCARVGTTSVVCWGANDAGQLGDGNISSPGMATSTPVTVTGLSGTTELALGNDHSCARRDDDVLSCWGGNTEGQLGDGTMDDRPAATPAPLPCP